MDILVLDAQNDCHCDTETYESDVTADMLVLTENGIECRSNRNRLPCPMIPGKPTEEDLRVLMETAMEHASKVKSSPTDVYPIHKLGEQNGIEFYSPDPEFFGVLACNLRGWGAWCIPAQIIRKPK